MTPHKTSQQAHARLASTLDLRHSRINTALAIYPRTRTVTSLLHFNKQILTKPPSFTRDLRHTSLDTTESPDYSLNTLGK